MLPYDSILLAGTKVAHEVVVEEDSVEAEEEASGEAEEMEEDAAAAVDVVDLVVVAVNATTAIKKGILQENAQKGIVAATGKQKGTITKSNPRFMNFHQLDILQLSLHRRVSWNFLPKLKK